MIYRIERKKINLDRMTPVASFSNGYIYGYTGLTKPSILKVYSKNINNLPEEDKMRNFTKISSIHFLLPTKLLFANDKFSGYTLKAVNKTGKYNKMINTPIDVLYDNISSMEEEISTLSNKSIVLKGMNYLDTIYNGELYITNPDKYVDIDLNRSDSSFKIEDVNNLLFNSLLQEIFTHELKSERVNRSSIVKFINMMSNKDMYVKSSDFLDDVVDEENIKEYVKKI